MTIQKIEANGITLAIENRGPHDAVPLILVRGQGSQMAHWPGELIEGFVSAGFRTVMFDNRDVGLSQRFALPGLLGDADEILDLLRRGETPKAAYGIEDMARDVIGLMDALGLDKAHVFGISMGGMITQQVILEAPERLLSATIVMSACRPAAQVGMGGQAALVERAEQLLVRTRTREEYLSDQVAEHAKWGSPGYPMPEAEIRAMGGVAYDRGVDADGLNRQVIALSCAPDRRPGLAQSEVPCLVINGEDDTLVPLELGKEIADTIPASEFRAVPGMGHIITPLLAPLIVETVVEFIARRVG
ncbi:alpha/beta fold hydrolase [Aestuariivita boseongensis]|uniref:alpha/beta fold hydrolase n=1 Tax=Aestuariivita boseongensis TaxID=1470562 RepID=UPI000681415A|nr:alpha/beta hydrolase [Aestuariivita boseongensis]